MTPATPSSRRAPLQTLHQDVADVATEPAAVSTGTTHFDWPPEPATARWRTRIHRHGDTLFVVINPDTDEPPLGWPDEIFAADDGRVVWRFRFVGGSLHVWRVLRNDAVDNSQQPAEIFYDLQDYVPHSEQHHCIAALGDAILGLAESAGGTPTPDTRHRGLRYTIATLTWPLLATATHLGGDVPFSIPRPLIDALRCSTARGAAETLFGEKAHRPVVRELARSLRPPPNRWGDAHVCIDLRPVIAATLGRDVLTPNDLAAVLSTRPGPARDQLDLDAGDLDMIRGLLARIGRCATLDVLNDAVTGDHGMSRLSDAAAAWSFAAGARVPSSNGLEDLYRRCTELARSIGVEDAPLLYPPEIEEHDGEVLDDLAGSQFNITLPRRTTTLVAWGRKLQNCLGTYAQRAFDGNIWVVGVKIGGRLAYIFDLRPGAREFELVGVRNQPADTDVWREVYFQLREWGLLDGHLQPTPPPGGRRRLRTFSAPEPF